MRSSRLGLFVLLLSAVVSDTIAAQSVRFVREATFPSSPEFFGSAVSEVGDINGDGIDDIAVANGISVRVLSGVDGAAPAGFSSSNGLMLQFID